MKATCDLSVKEIEDIKELAREKRVVLGFSNDAPIANDLTLVLEKLLITPLELPFKGNGQKLAFSAMLLCSQSETFIGINTADYFDKQIFAIAHELYHFYTKTRSVQNWQEGNGNVEIETKANRFAAEYLLPEDSLKRRIINEFGKESLENVPQQTLLRFIARIHCIWYLPYRSVVKRLREIKAITQKQYQELYDIDERNPEGEYWRLGKAFDRDIFLRLNTKTETTGTSAYAIETIVRNFEHNIIDEHTFAETLKMFNIDPADFGYAITISQEDKDEIEEFISGGDSES